MINQFLYELNNMTQLKLPNSLDTHLKLTIVLSAKSKRLQTGTPTLLLPHPLLLLPFSPLPHTHTNTHTPVWLWKRRQPRLYCKSKQLPNLGGLKDLVFTHISCPPAGSLVNIFLSVSVDFPQVAHKVRQGMSSARLQFKWGKEDMPGPRLPL